MKAFPVVEGEGWSLHGETKEGTPEEVPLHNRM